MCFGDNKDLAIDGVTAWTATAGVQTLAVAEYEAACRGFVARLLLAMEQLLPCAGSRRARGSLSTAT